MVRDSLRDIKEKSLSSISPEQKRALQMLLSHWPSAKEIRSSSPFPNFFVTGYTRCSAAPISVDELPCGEHWIWRQCNAKVATQLDDITTVVIQKFNTREKKTLSGVNKQKRPTYKLWNLRVLQNDIAFTFLFCERGVDLTPITPQKAIHCVNTSSSSCQQILPYYYVPVTHIIPEMLQTLPDPLHFLQTQPSNDLEYLETLLASPEAI